MTGGQFNNESRLGIVNVTGNELVRPIPMLNGGNRCYINANLQSLLNCPPVIDLLQSEEEHELLGYLRDLVRNYNTTPMCTENFRRMIAALHEDYNNDQQQAADNYLTCLLDSCPQLKELCKFVLVETYECIEHNEVTIVRSFETVFKMHNIEGFVLEDMIKQNMNTTEYLIEENVKRCEKQRCLEKYHINV